MAQAMSTSPDDQPGDALEIAVATLTAASDGDLCSPLCAAVSMPGAVVSTLGSPMGSETVCASTKLGARIDEIQIDLGEGPSWEALRTRLPVTASDLQVDGGALWPGTWAALRELDVGALFAFPLYVSTLGIGSIALYSMTARELSDADIERMSRLAAIVSSTLLRRALNRLDAPDDGAQEEPYSRREVHQATGMVAARNSIGVDDALLLLRGHAFAAGRPVRDVAADVIARRLDLRL
ncbi:GAF domain-containing protein [Microbacterium kyungheense]